MSVVRKMAIYTRGAGDGKALANAGGSGNECQGRPESLRDATVDIMSPNTIGKKAAVLREWRGGISDGGHEGGSPEEVDKLKGPRTQEKKGISDLKSRIVDEGAPIGRTNVGGGLLDGAESWASKGKTGQWAEKSRKKK